MRNLPAHAGKQGRRVVSAFAGTAFAQDAAGTAKTRWRKVAGQLRPKVPRLAGLMDEAENDVLACMTFPAAHRIKLHSTNSPGASTARPGAILLEQNDAWAAAAGRPADPRRVARDKRRYRR